MSRRTGSKATVANVRRRWLLGCSISLTAALLLAGAAWWLISRHLGDFLASTLREQANAALNGRLEFDRLEVDLAGRAVITNATLYLADHEEPLAGCPQTVVGFDLLNLFGPNRGRRALTVTLHEPRLRLVREPDGKLNLQRLLKPREQEAEPIGVAVHLRQARVDLTDWCLLNQAYPEIPQTEGLAGRLLEELGYSAAGAAEVAAHTEQLTVNGTVLVNTGRGELSAELQIDRDAAGGRIAASVSGSPDGAAFSAQLDFSNINFDSLDSYVLAVFPGLTIGPPSGTAAGEVHAPYFSGRLADGKLYLRKQRDQQPSISGRAELEETRLVSNALPELYFPRATLVREMDQDALAGDLRLLVLNTEVTGTPQVDLRTREIAGRLRITCAEPSLLAARLAELELPLEGRINAELTLAGDLSKPVVNAKLDSDELHYDEVMLGRLSGAVELAATALVLKGVRLEGGDAPLHVSGEMDLATQDGVLAASVSSLPIAKALELASKLKLTERPPEVEVAGDISASARIALRAGVATTTLHAKSPLLTVAGQRLQDVEVKASVEPATVRIEEASAILVSAAPVNLAGFSSEGELRTAVRAGGTISTAPGQQQPALAIVGEGITENLVPTQALISFKVLGPADDPELRGQLKTKHAESPLLLRAQGHYRRGFAPWTASLTWQQTTADFNGEIDFPGQRLNGKVTADEVDLRRFSADQRLEGTLSAEATVGGTFEAPTVNGQLSAPHVAVHLPQRSYHARDLAAGFKLAEGQAVSISNGSFTFEDGSFTARGVLGRAGSDLTIACTEFDLFSALAQAPVARPAAGKTAETRPPLEISSAGPLTVKLTGELTNPTAAITYSSGPGVVEGHSFGSAALSATVDLRQAQLERLQIVSAEGQLTASGTATYEPLAYAADMTIQHFDIAVLTALAGSNLLAGLRGYLDGQMSFSGDAAGYSADGHLALSGGSFNGVAISSASAELETRGQAVQISSGRIVAEGTTLTASGTIGPTLADTRISVESPSLNLALLAPFMPDAVPPLAGSVSADAQLSPGAGAYPNLDLELALTGGSLSAGDLQLTAFSTKAALRKDVLTIERLDLATASSTVAASGKLDLAALERGAAGARALPLELQLDCRNLDLGDLREFVPAQYQAQWPSGTVTGRLNARPSRGRYPDLDVNLRSTGGGITMGAVQFESMEAEATVRRDQLQLTRCLLASGASSFDLKANLNLAIFAAGDQDLQALPLDVTLNSEAFDLADIAGLLPAAQRVLLPSGTLTCRSLRLTGTTADPRLTGSASFDLTDLPQATDFVARVAGQVKFDDNEFDIPVSAPVLITPSGGIAGGAAQLSGSGILSLNPPGLEDGTVTLQLAPAGQRYLQIDTTEVGSPLLAGKHFKGQVGGVLNIKASQRAADKKKRDFTPVIWGNIAVTEEGQASSLTVYRLAGEEGEAQPAPFRFAAENEGDGLRVAINPTTTFDYRPVLDLKVELAGDITLYGTPGLLDEDDPDAFRIKGTLEIPRGSMRVYRHVVRLGGERGRITFADAPGDMYPYLTARGALELPRVLSASQVTTTTTAQPGGSSTASQRGDLIVYFTFANHKLDPNADPTAAVQLSSEPPLPQDQILAYLLGGAADLLTGSGELGEFAQGELYAFGTSFISRAVEDIFDLESFYLGGTGSEENPFFMDVEKAVTPDFSVTYYRDFYSEANQSEEFGVRYRLYQEGYQNLELEVNYLESGFSGSGSEFMFVFTTAF